MKKEKWNEHFNVNKDKDTIIQQKMNKEIVMSLKKSMKANVERLFEKTNPEGYKKWKNKKKTTNKKMKGKNGCEFRYWRIW